MGFAPENDIYPNSDIFQNAVNYRLCKQMYFISE